MPRPRLPRPARPRTLAAALLCAGTLGLGVLDVGAGAGTLSAVQVRSLPHTDLWGRGRAGLPRPGPRPPQPPVTLTLAQTRMLLARAAQIVAALQIGSVRRAPAGAEAVLIYRGQAVSAVGLDLQGNVQPLATPPLPAGGPLGRRPGLWAGAPSPPLAPAPADADPVTLGAPARARLSAQVRGLYVSGAVRVAGPQVRVTLLSGAVAVAELRFGAGGTLRPLSDPVRDGPAGR